MARRKRKDYGPKFWQSKKSRGKGYAFDLGMKEETRKEMVAIVMLVLGVVMLLAIFGKAGVVGQFVIQESRLLFGYLAYLLPVVFLAVVVSAVNPKLYEVRLSTVIGIILLFFSFGGMMHFILASDNALNVAKEGGGGGYIGYFASTLFVQFLGGVASFLVLLALFCLSLSMALNTSIMSIWASLVGGGDEQEEVHVNEGGTRVSVFTTVRRGLGGLKLRRRDIAPRSSAPVLETKPFGTTRLLTSSGWNVPPIDLLETSDTKPNPGNVQKNIEAIRQTLKEFNIEVSMQDVNVGPTVSQYTFKPTEGVKLANIVARQNDLALALAAKSLRMEAPIPGQSAVGVEIPNKSVAKVTLRELLESPEYHKTSHALNIPLGRDVSGMAMVIDLEKMPHLLIAGATGSGKSVAINSIIVTYIMNNSPQDLRLMLVDPKRVELTGYNGIGHLLTPVITEPDKTVNALKWAVAEMEDRYRIFAEIGARNIAAYNEKPGPKGKIPRIVIIIDELADLMAVSANDVEGSIVRLAQMARATGIHLIVATQRPSVDVITGLIKANIPSRIAFTVASQVDSRTILDVGGAEKLLGSGDMLYLGGDITKPKRLQGCFVSDKEITAVTGFLKKDSFAQYDESITDYHTVSAGAIGTGEGAGDDELYRDAMSIVVQAGKASASLLQRRMRIGYARAARLLDLLEHEGVIGPPDGSRPRDVLMSTNELRDPTERY